MAKKLSEILGSKTKVNFEFIDLVTDEAQRDGSPIVRLVLKNPIPVVYGRKINDQASGDSVTLEANDVVMVSLGSEALAEIDKMEEDGKSPFTWTEEGKAGTFVTNDLRMDVSSSQEVWVVKTSLAQFGRNQRNARKQQQNSNLINRIRQSVTKKEFADTNVTANAGAEVVAEK